MKNNNGESIELTLPVNAAYVSAIRLTASSISNRMRFDVDEIEDVKSAVSEACTFLIKNADSKKNKSFKISFNILPDTLKIYFTMADMQAPNSVDSEMGLMMIKALMDEMDIETVDNSLYIAITKKHKISRLA